jgi:hypothetical protein
VCIFVREDQTFNKINTLLYFAVQTLEVFANELKTKSYNLKILLLYRASFENFNQFRERERLDTTQK